MQVPEVPEYLEIQYLLGRSHEELKQDSEALSAYLRYLKAYLVQRTADPVILSDVISRIPIMLKNKPDRFLETSQILSGLSSLSLPDEIRPEVNLLTAKIALHLGNLRAAHSALDQITNGYPTLIAKAHYLRALIYHQEKDATKAETEFSQAIEKSEDPNIKDLAHLGIARLLAQNQRRELALSHYGLVSDGSSSFRDALFESTFVAMATQNFRSARDKATLFLARYPEGLDAIEIRTILAFLDMKAGDLEQATIAINAGEKALKDIDRWVITKLSTNTFLSQDLLLSLSAVLGAQVAMPKQAEEGLQLFMRIGEVNSKLAEEQGTIHNLAATLGRVNTWQVRPSWEHRSTQLKDLADQILVVGHKLAATERHLYQGVSDKVTTQKLLASERRRTLLLSPAAVRKRQSQNWRTFSRYDQATRKLAELSDRLAVVDAEINATRYLAGAYNPSSLKSIPELLKVRAEMQDRLKDALTGLRTSRLIDQASLTSHQATKKYFAQYSAALYDETQVFKTLRPQINKGIDRLNADAAALNWEKWEVASQMIFKLFSELDQDIATDLADKSKRINTLKNEHQLLRDETIAINRKLEKSLGDASAYITEQIRIGIEDRLEKNRKWLGDIDWLMFKAKEEEESKLIKAYELEKQILSDHLTDLKQGVLWQWPN
jgi:hypothetical protein